MSTETFIAIAVPVIMVPILGVIGYFIKGLLNTIKEDLEVQTTKIEKLSTSFNSFNLSLTKLEATFKSTERDLERAHDGVKNNTNSSIKSSERLTTHGRDIAALNNNLSGFAGVVESNSERIKQLEEKVISIIGH